MVMALADISMMARDVGPHTGFNVVEMILLWLEMIQGDHCWFYPRRMGAA